jgi:hypothetical protein
MTNTLPSGLLRSLLFIFSVLSGSATAETFHVTRLNDAEPILTRQHFEQVNSEPFEGQNINGPSVIRIPEWIPADKRAAPEAKYYMYFAHHKGRYIRLAWAEDIEGPWSLHNTGHGVVDGERGALDIGNNRVLELANSLAIESHIASPDVHVDNLKKRIILYFHGPASHNGVRLSHQRSFVATAPWGLDFSSGIVPVTLSDSYLRAFEYDGVLQALVRGKYYTPHDSEAPWSTPANFSYDKHNLWTKWQSKFMDFSDLKYEDGEAFAPGKTRLRHAALYRDGTTLQVFFTMTGHSPERVLVTSVNLASDCWYCAPPQAVPEEILRAEQPWEGSEVAPEPSRKGPEYRLANAIRNPYVFEDEGKLYLFYVGGGERAIGIASLTSAADKPQKTQ